MESEQEKLELVPRVEVPMKMSGFDALGSLQDMRSKLELQDKKRAMIWDYIENNFVKGVDYGPADDRNPKATLLKPGAEKACKLFQTHARWIRDDETWEMLGKPAGVICYKCLIIDNATGEIVGEGRGAEKVGNKQRDANKAIKNAEKCSLVDAALYTFMLSERFTQDEGAASKTQMAELKDQLLADISEKRAGTPSEFTDIQWLIKILQQEIHKRRIDSFGEHAHIRKILFEQEKYDFGTGNKTGK